MNDYGHWDLLCEHANDAWGFIYLITNVTNNKKYIGKKQLSFKQTRKPLKGMKNKRRSTIESDWKTYTGSCKELNEDIERIGKSNFKFEIVKYCFSKSHLAYEEAKMQFDNNVLIDDSWYNGIINLRIGKRGLSKFYEKKQITL